MAVLAPSDDRGRFEAVFSELNAVRRMVVDGHSELISNKDAAEARRLLRRARRRLGQFEEHLAVLINGL